MNTTETREGFVVEFLNETGHSTIGYLAKLNGKLRVSPQLVHARVYHTLEFATQDAGEYLRFKIGERVVFRVQCATQTITLCPV